MPIPARPSRPGWVDRSRKPEDFGNVSVVNGKIWPFLEVEPRRYRLRLLSGSNSRFYNLARKDTTTEAEDETKRLKLMLDGKEFEDPISEKPKLGSTEVWRLINATEDVHPIHLHLVKFQMVGRTPFDAEKYLEAFDEAKSEAGEEGASAAAFTKPPVKDFVTGPAVKPDANEMGWKDTVRATPGFITDIIATFDIKGRYVWHCHIIEHEDHVMMRPFEVV